MTSRRWDFPALQRRLVVHVMWFDPEREWRGKTCPVCALPFATNPRSYAMGKAVHGDCMEAFFADFYASLEADGMESVSS